MAQGTGLGASLLRDAMLRTVQAADIAGIRAFVIHAKGDQAQAFYEHFDFVPLVTDPYHLYCLDVIRRMAARYGDDEIARVLNRLGRRTATSKCWNEHRVAMIRRKHTIAGQRRSTPDRQILTARTAAQYCGVSEGMIRRAGR